MSTERKATLYDALDLKTHLLFRQYKRRELHEEITQAIKALEDLRKNLGVLYYMEDGHVGITHLLRIQSLFYQFAEIEACLAERVHSQEKDREEAYKELEDRALRGLHWNRDKA